MFGIFKKISIIAVDAMDRYEDFLDEKIEEIEQRKAKLEESTPLEYEGH